MTALLLGLHLPAGGEEAQLQGFAGFSKVVAQIEQQRVQADDGSMRDQLFDFINDWDTLVEDTKAGRAQGEAAADAWLALFDTHLRLKREAPAADWSAWIGEEYFFQLVFDLPEPPAWPLIAAGLEKRAQDPEFGGGKSRALIGLLPHFLKADAEGLHRAWQALLVKQPQAKADKLVQVYEGESMMELNDTIRRYLPAVNGTNAVADTAGAPGAATDKPDSTPKVNVKVEAFVRLLDNVEALSDPEEKRQLFRQHPANYRESLVPPLVPLLGKKQATVLLRRMFELGVLPSSLDMKDAATKNLAVDLILAEPGLPAGPIWSLVDLERGPQLAARFAKTFPAEVAEAERKGDYGWQQAQVFLAARKLMDGAGAAEATAKDVLRFKLLKSEHSSHGKNLIKILRGSGEDQALFDFSRHLVAEEPTHEEFWKVLFELDAPLGRTAELHRLARRTIRESKQLEVRVHLLDALAFARVANDEMAAATEDFRSLVAARRELCETAKVGSYGSWQYSDAQNAHDALRGLGSALVRIGKSKEQPDLVKLGHESLWFVHQRMLQARDISDNYTATADFTDVWDGALAAIYYIEKERGDPVRAEKEILRCMADTRRLIAHQEKKHGYAYNGGGQSVYSVQLAPFQSALLGLYHRQDRHADMIKLVEHGPYWRTIRFSEMVHEDGSTGLPLIEAYEKTGQPDKARELLETLFRCGYWAAHDPAYETLLRLVEDTEAALKFLDELHARNAFEERPLIWKAVVLLRQNRVDAAETAVRRAIAIDPSDGDQPHGDRMRAYDVLAEILAKQGRAEETEKLRDIVAAIRRAEEADRLFWDGQKMQAFDAYRQSLRRFDDAYCIQSRLALRLAGAGEFEAAADHFEKAFELMPDSFGRMESQCSKRCCRRRRTIRGCTICSRYCMRRRDARRTHSRAVGGRWRSIRITSMPGK